MKFIVFSLTLLITLTKNRVVHGQPSCSEGVVLQLLDPALTKDDFIVVRGELRGMRPDLVVYLPTVNDALYAPTARKPAPRRLSQPRELSMLSYDQPKGYPKPSGILGLWLQLVENGAKGLVNLSMLPVNAELLAINASNDLFIYADAAGSTTPPEFHWLPVFDDSLWPAPTWETKQAAHNARQAARNKAFEEINRRVVDAYTDSKCIVKDGRCKFSLLLASQGTPRSITLTGPECVSHNFSTQVLPSLVPAVDDSKGASVMQGWHRDFAVDDFSEPSVRAAASARRAYESKEPLPEEPPAGASWACRLETKRSAARKKKAILFARFTAGDVTTTALDITPRGPGEPLFFVVPRVTLEAGARVKLAFVDAAGPLFGAAAVQDYEGQPALAFTHKRFAASCHVVAQAVATQLHHEAVVRAAALGQRISEAKKSPSAKKDEDASLKMLQAAAADAMADALVYMGPPVAQTTVPTQPLN